MFLYIGCMAKKPTKRNKTVHVKSSRGRKSSSTAWLRRQLNDPYVLEAQRLGYRSRAAFKLTEMEEKLKLIKPGMLIVDLGAAPGGWAQIAVNMGAEVIGLDLIEMEEMPGATFLQMDFTDDDAPEALLKLLDGRKPDMVISDLSPYTTGHQKTDHLRIMMLVEMAYDFTKQVLKPGGHFIAKVFQGGAQSDIVKMVKADFQKMKHFKPKASRKESPETYLIALNFGN